MAEKLPLKSKVTSRSLTLWRGYFEQFKLRKYVSVTFSRLFWNCLGKAYSFFKFLNDNFSANFQLQGFLIYLQSQNFKSNFDPLIGSNWLILRSKTPFLDFLQLVWGLFGDDLSIVLSHKKGTFWCIYILVYLMIPSGSSALGSHDTPTKTTTRPC